MKVVIKPKEGWSEARSNAQTEFDTLPFSVSIVVEDAKDDALLKELYHSLPSSTDLIEISGSDFIIDLIIKYLRNNLVR